LNKAYNKVWDGKHMSVRFPLRQAWNKKWPYLRCFRFCFGIFH